MRAKRHTNQSAHRCTDRPAAGDTCRPTYLGLHSSWNEDRLVMSCLLLSFVPWTTSDVLFIKWRYWNFQRRHWLRHWKTSLWSTAHTLKQPTNFTHTHTHTHTHTPTRLHTHQYTHTHANGKKNGAFSGQYTLILKSVHAVRVMPWSSLCPFKYWTLRSTPSPFITEVEFFSSERTEAMQGAHHALRLI